MSERSGPSRKRRGRRRGRRRGSASPSASAESGASTDVVAPADSASPAAPDAADVGRTSADATSSRSAPSSEASPSDTPSSEAPAHHALPDRRRDRATLETSAGGIVYRVQDGEPLFLLIRDSYRNWGFPKGHLESGEAPEDAAVREVAEETGLGALRVDGAIETIDWFFRFRGKLVHKVCHFYLMRTHHRRTQPQREEGITACRWAPFDEATRLISYANARAVLVRANDMVQAVQRGTRRAPGATRTDVSKVDASTTDASTPGASTQSASPTDASTTDTPRVSAPMGTPASPAAPTADAPEASPRSRRRRSRSRRRRRGGGNT